ncbi:MAG: putative Ig domain-containing protein [Gammaproteobacteria bacterium]|nr:putative Ig domain-containing protein [Gammaproteobacteria bacterium]
MKKHLELGVTKNRYYFYCTILYLILLANVSYADIIITGAIVEADTSKVPTFINQSNSEIYLFHEKKNVKLTNTVKVDLSASGVYAPACITKDANGFCIKSGIPHSFSLGEITSGTVLDSYLLHFDPAVVSKVSGSITFDGNIVGIIVTKQNLDSTDTLFGLDRHTYPTGIANRGLEIDLQQGAYDGIYWNGNKLEILNLQAENPGDQIRLLVRPGVRNLTRYEIVDLGVVNDPIEYITPTDINNSGEIVGYYAYPNPASPSSPRIIKGFRSTDNKLSEISGTGTNTYITAINNNGVIAGTTLFQTVTEAIFVKSPSDIVLLNSKGPVYDINDFNIGVGGGFYATVYKEYADAFSLLNHSGRSNALGINNSGKVVGRMLLNSGCCYRSFVANSDGTDFKQLHGDEIAQSEAWSINDQGLIAGKLYDDQYNIAYIYDNDVMIRLGWINGKANQALLVEGMNNRGEIVGRTHNSKYPFIYSKMNGVNNLEELVDQYIEQGWKSIAPLGINDYGYIVGSGVHNGLVRGFVLKPINSNSDPMIDPIGDIVGSENSVIAFTVNATDPDGDSLQYSMRNGPEGSTLNQSTGEFYWLPDSTQAGVYSNIEITVTDSGDPVGVAVELVTIIVGDVNLPPTLSAPTTINVEERQLVSFVVDVNDLDGDEVNVTVVWSNRPTDARLECLLPCGANFNALDGVNNQFSWTPDFGQTGVYIFEFIATDNGLPPLETTRSVIVTVGETTDPITLTNYIIEQVQNYTFLSVRMSLTKQLKSVKFFIETGNMKIALRLLFGLTAEIAGLESTGRLISSGTVDISKLLLRLRFLLGMVD